MARNDQACPLLAVLGLNNYPSFLPTAFPHRLSVWQRTLQQKQRTFHIFSFHSDTDMLTKCLWSPFGEVVFWMLLESKTLGERDRPLPRESWPVTNHWVSKQFSSPRLLLYKRLWYVGCSYELLDLYDKERALGLQHMHSARWQLPLNTRELLVMLVENTYGLNIFPSAFFCV